MATAVQFGAGNIGRGFLAQLFCESGFDTIFVDVDPVLLSEIAQRGAYDIEIVGAGAGAVRVTRVSAQDGRDQAGAARRVAEAAIVATAVGANVLRHVAAPIAEGLEIRHRESGGPLNILLCENLHDAADVLRNAVRERLAPDTAGAILAKTGFVQAVVSRMVPLQTAEARAKDPLAIRVEAYRRLPVDGRGVRGALPPIAGVEPVDNFEALVDQKLYTHNCAHAVLGYLGWRAGLEFGWQALEDPEIRTTLAAAMRESGDALVRKYGIPAGEQRAHEAELLARFANRGLGDTCRRLARDPVRKLAKDDRLVGAARLCEVEEIEPLALCHAIAAALTYSEPDDPSAESLQAARREHGDRWVLENICGLDPHGTLVGRIIAELEMLDAH